MSNIKIYAKSILFPLIIGGIVGLLTSNSGDYDLLIKPAFSPPSILFPIVWTILYILMGISYGLLKDKSLTDSEIDTIYYLQLFFNFTWSFIFFTFNLRLLAYIWIIILAILIAIMIYKFYKSFDSILCLQIFLFDQFLHLYLL